ACGVTLYFFRQNLLGIHESSGKALKIMIATTVMAGVILLWCALTLLVKGPANPFPSPVPDLHPKVEYKETEVTDPVTGKPAKVWEKDPVTGELVPDLDAD